MVKKIIVDLDDTLSFNEFNNYKTAKPNKILIDKLHYYKSIGFEIIINTARNMRTYHGNVGKINANTLPVIIEWLTKHDIPYDEIYVGKPWCGFEGFYVDDKAIRPSEFVRLNYKEIIELLAKDKICE